MKTNIGIFDSGVGGLSVLRAIRAQMLEEEITAPKGSGCVLAKDGK